MRKAVLMILLVVVSSSAMAETARLIPNPYVNYYGVGANTCGQYLEDREKDRKRSGIRGSFYTAWFKGYVSGFNQFASKQVNVQLEHSAVLTYFDKWCRDNPSGTVVGAALCLTGASGGAPIDFACKP